MNFLEHHVERAATSTRDGIHLPRHGKSQADAKLRPCPLPKVFHPNKIFW